MNNLIEKLKSMKIENRLLLLALACGLLAAVTGYAFISFKETALMKAMEPVKVLVSAKYIAPGTRLDEDMVKESKIPLKFLTSAHATEFKQIKGRVAMVPFIEGEPILLNKVSDKAGELSGAVPTGLRAIAVSVDEESSVGYMIKPGDNVDVLLTYEEFQTKPARNVTATILQAVQVAAVGAGYSGNTGDRKYSTISLAVTPEEAELLTFAGSRGRISFALRPAGEIIKERIKSASFEDLLRQIRENEKGGEKIIKSTDAEEMPERTE